MGILKKLLNEAKKAVKVDLELGKGKSGYYFITKVGYDANGNWSYWIAKGGNKPKKVQHQGGGGKILADTTQKELNTSLQTTVKELIEYMEL